MLKLNLKIFKTVKLTPNTLNRKLAQSLLHAPGLTASPFQSESALPLQSSVPGSAGAGLLLSGLQWWLCLPLSCSLKPVTFEILGSLSLQSVLLWLQLPLCSAETWAVAHEEESKSWVLPLLSLHYFHSSSTPKVSQGLGGESRWISMFFSSFRFPHLGTLWTLSFNLPLHFCLVSACYHMPIWGAPCLFHLLGHSEGC